MLGHTMVPTVTSQLKPYYMKSLAKWKLELIYDKFIVWREKCLTIVFNDGSQTGGAAGTDGHGLILGHWKNETSHVCWFVVCSSICAQDSNICLRGVLEMFHCEDTFCFTMRQMTRQQHDLIWNLQDGVKRHTNYKPPSDCRLSRRLLQCVFEQVGVTLWLVRGKKKEVLIFKNNMHPNYSRKYGNDVTCTLLWPSVGRCSQSCLTINLQIHATS